MAAQAAALEETVEAADAAAVNGAAGDGGVAEDGVEVETFTYAVDGDAVDADVLTGPVTAMTPVTSTGEEAVVAVPVRSALPDSETRADGVGAPYSEAPSTPLGTREDLGRVGSPEVRRTIADAVRETVEAEGPITTGRLARSIGRRFGFDRVAAGRQQFILEHVPAELVHSSALGTFVWPRHLDLQTWRGFRTTPDDVDRLLPEVAPEEIINAMAYVAAEYRPRDDEELFRSTLSLFGQRRLTGMTTERLEACRDLAVERSRLIFEDGRPWRAGA